MLEGSFRPPSAAVAVDAPQPPSRSGPPCLVRSPGTPPDCDPSANPAPYVAPWPAYSSSHHRPFEAIQHHSGDSAPPRAGAVRDQDAQREKESKAKKKPAGSACNSCHRLKTRCSGGSPCERCASHKVACEFDRSLIYRSPLASSSQQASLKNASQAVCDVDDQTGPRSKKRPRTSTNVTAAHSPPGAISHDTPSIQQSIKRQTSPKIVNFQTAQAQSQTCTVDQSSSGSAADRLAALEQNVKTIMGALGLVIPGSGITSLISKEEDTLEARKRIRLLSSANLTLATSERYEDDAVMRDAQPSENDPVVAGVLTEQEAICLIDLFIQNCLPYLPILRNASYKSIRSRSQLLFTTMLAISAAFVSSRASSTSQACSGLWVESNAVDHLTNLAYQNLAATLIAPTHTADDICATLFLASWRLRPEGQGPARPVLLGHAARMVVAAGFGQRERVAGEKGSKSWRDRLFEYRLAVCTAALDTLTESGSDASLCMEVSEEGSTLIDLARDASLHFDDVTAGAMIQALAELATLSHNSGPFVASVSKTDVQGRVISEVSATITASFGFNAALDAWGSRWIYPGSAWASLLGRQQRTMRLLADDYRVTLNLAVSHLLLSSDPPVKGLAYVDCLNSAMDRMNTTSTAIIQSHKDSLREGSSLAFCPDIVTEGLVSAAMTLIQLASKPVDTPMTPPNSDTVKLHTPISASFPSPTSPSVHLFRPLPTAQQFLEPAVASHFIKVAIEVLTGSERRQAFDGSRSAMIYRYASEIGFKGLEDIARGHGSGVVTNASHVVTSNDASCTRQTQGLVKSRGRSASYSSADAELNGEDGRLSDGSR